MVINALVTENGLTNTLADNQVTETKIANGAVTAAKLGSDVDLTPADGSITPAKLDRTYLESTGGSVSGNLLVGKTTTSTANQGIQINPSGRIDSTSDGAEALRLNRKTSDGDIINFRKDNTTVGSISSRGGVATNLILRTATNQGAGIGGANSGILPCDEEGLQDAEINLGSSGTRWKDLYLSGTIILSNVPTSSSGLPSGAIYSDGGTLKIV